MVKIRGNIIFAAGFILVFLIWIGSPANSSGKHYIACETAEMQTYDGSSGILSAHDDIYEDEQITQVFWVIPVAQPIAYFSDNQKQRIINQPCLIPWEPPKI